MLRRGGDATDSIRGVMRHASGVNGIVSVGGSVAFYVPLLEYPQLFGIIFCAIFGIIRLVHPARLDPCNVKFNFRTSSFRSPATVWKLILRD
jgi:hypothetical protein